MLVDKCFIVLSEYKQKSGGQYGRHKCTARMRINGRNEAKANEKMIYTILRGLQKELNIEKELSYLSISLSLYVCTCTLHRNVM